MDVVMKEAGKEGRPSNLAEVTMALDNKEDDDMESPPLSPIVGYQYHTDDENVISESSETDDETAGGVSQANAQLERITKQSLTPEPDTPRSAMRRRLRKRRYRQMQEELKVNEDGGENKRLKFNEVSAEDQMILDKDDDAFSLSGESAEETLKIAEASLMQTAPHGQETEVIPEKKEPPRDTTTSSTSMHMPKEGAYFGLKTASGKEVKISESAIRNAKQTLDNATIDPIPAPIDDPNGPNLSFVGFKTASGKAVQISEAALKRAIAREQAAEALVKDKSKVPIPDKAITRTSIDPKRISSPGMGFMKPANPTKKFKPPTRITPAPSSTSTKTEAASSATSNSANTSTNSGNGITLGNFDPGMTQEMLDSIEACLADNDEDF